MQCKMRCMRLDGSDRWECMVLVPGRSFMLLAGWLVASLVRCGRDKVRFAAGRPRPGPVPAAAPPPLLLSLRFDRGISLGRGAHTSIITCNPWRCPASACMGRARFVLDRPRPGRPGEESSRGSLRRAAFLSHQLRIVPVCRPRARPASIPARAHPRRGAGTCGPWIHSSTSTSTTRLPSYS